MEKKVYLIGLRGSGKSSVARLLAGAVGWDWVDADRLLEEQAGKTIRDIFADEGEVGFRQKESEILIALSAREKTVIATGGGVVLREENRQRLRESGIVVWLTADAKTLWERITSDPASSSQRPALTPVSGLEEISVLMDEREPYYRECATLTVDTSGRTPESVAQLILSSLSHDR